MDIRPPVVAGQFYPADPVTCAKKLDRYLSQDLPRLPDRIVAGVVPHAGWDFSGPTAAKVFAAIRDRSAPDTFVLLSAVHRWGAARSAVYAGGAWQTPLGEVGIDEELAQAVLAEGNGLLVDAPGAHGGEHSSEVQLPFIQHLFPGARILPILIPPDDLAARVGEAIGRAIMGMEKNAVLVGTTDLTHYGATYYGFAPAGTGESALEWVRANDERFIERMLKMQAEEIVAEATQHHNSCGAGAVAATIAAARLLGAKKGLLLEYTTSHQVRPRGRATDFVGYAAVVFS